LAEAMEAAVCAAVETLLRRDQGGASVILIAVLLGVVLLHGSLTLRIQRRRVDHRWRRVRARDA